METAARTERQLHCARHERTRHADVEQLHAVPDFDADPFVGRHLDAMTLAALGLKGLHSYTTGMGAEPPPSTHAWICAFSSAGIETHSSPIRK